MFYKATLFIVITLLATNNLFGNDGLSVQPDNKVSVTTTILGNHVTWKASNSLVTTFYILQRSTDGKSFHTVAMIQNNQQEKDYTFLDQKMTSTPTFYRILNVNMAGEGHYSKIIRAQPYSIVTK